MDFKQLLDLWDSQLPEMNDGDLDRFIRKWATDLDAEDVEQFRALAGRADDDGLKGDTEELSGAVADTDSLPSKPMRMAAGMEPVTDYILVRPLGRGGFGEVWEARGPGGIPLALKFVSMEPRQAHTEERALEVMKNVRHPHLLSISGTWRNSHGLVIATELADETLQDRFEKMRNQNHRGISRDELLGYFSEAAKGLDFLNTTDSSGRGGIQHRDIKPQNLFLTGGSLKVGDFGLARMLQDTLGTHSGAMTVQFAAPECFDGSLHANSDQYSLAITYCYLRGGKCPFTGSVNEVIKGHQLESPVLEMVPATERPVLKRALHKSPSARWTSCRAFVSALVESADNSTSLQWHRHPPPSTSESFRGSLAVLAVGMAKKILSLCRLGIKPVAGLLVFVGVVFFLLNQLDLSEQRRKEATRRLRVLEATGTLQVIESNLQDVQTNLGPPVVNSAGMVLVPIPTGNLHTEVGEAWVGILRIRESFYFGTCEVTQEQFEMVMGRNPSQYKSPSFPVHDVTYGDALEFCERLSEEADEQDAGRSYRLPTSKEWQYACRAGSESRFFWGDSTNELFEFAWFGPNSGGRLHNVGQKTPSSWGLFDIHGNVREWCQSERSWRRPGEGDSRGGDYDDIAAICDASSYNTYPEGLIGFRVVMTK